MTIQYYIQDARTEEYLLKEYDRYGKYTFTRELKEATAYPDEETCKTIVEDIIHEDNLLEGRFIQFIKIYKI